MPNDTERLAMIERRKIVKSLSKKGYSAAKISKRLSKVKEGVYAASEATVLRDLNFLRKKRAKWDAIHSPHQMDKNEVARDKLIVELDELILSAKNKKQFKTAGELITKKARLQGIDKYVVPKEKKKEDIEAKYENRTDEEVNNVLFGEYKELSATLIRSAKNGKLNNIRKISVAVWRRGKDDILRKFFITRFGDEKEMQREQDKIKDIAKIVRE